MENQVEGGKGRGTRCTRELAWQVGIKTPPAPTTPHNRAVGGLEGLHHYCEFKGLVGTASPIHREDLSGAHISRSGSAKRWCSHPCSTLCP